MRGQIFFSFQQYFSPLCGSKTTFTVDKFLKLLKINHTVLSTDSLFIKSYPYLLTFCMKKYPIGVRLFFLQIDENHYESLCLPSRMT